MAIIKQPKLIINSDLMKVVIASYFRYRLRYNYVCTEYDCRDLIACNSKYMTEVEVKISYSDLKADKKKYKHNVYKKGLKDNPNYFYYAITEEMYDDGKSVKYIKENLNPSYGIMWIKDWREPIIMKRPTLLHKNKVSQKELSAILRRVSSENICLRKKLYELKLAQNTR